MKNLKFMLSLSCMGAALMFSACSSDKYTCSDYCSECNSGEDVSVCKEEICNAFPACKSKMDDMYACIHHKAKNVCIDLEDDDLQATWAWAAARSHDKAKNIYIDLEDDDDDYDDTSTCEKEMTKYFACMFTEGF